MQPPPDLGRNDDAERSTPPAARSTPPAARSAPPAARSTPLHASPARAREARRRDPSDDARPGRRAPAPAAATAGPAAGPPPPAAATPAPEEALRGTLDRLRAAFRRDGAPSLEERLGHLDRLEGALLARKHDIAEAISRDFGHRSPTETLMTDVYLVASTLRHTRAHLREWMQPEARSTSWPFLPGRSHVVHQPLGVVGILSPWNYPVNLALLPLVAALAAGNRAMIKPSEVTPRTSELLRRIVEETFAPDRVAVVTGGPEIGEAFARLPFDHLFFTGSPRVGRLVMRAAAENLVPVTLELGGKSPAIVAPGYPIGAAAASIMRGKCLNSGQTCVAPDYALVPAERVEDFVAECREAARRMYASFADNPDWTRIATDAHVARLRGYLDEAARAGARVVPLTSEANDPALRVIVPTLVVEPADGLRVMSEEIFGPILPVKGYRTLEEAIAYVNDRPRPLALYYFDRAQANVDRILRETTSGGVCVNDTMLQSAQDDLPFGGVGESGMGHYHGRAGFLTLSKQKAVFQQGRVNGASIFSPPYGKAVGLLLRALIGR